MGIIEMLVALFNFQTKTKMSLRVQIKLAFVLILISTYCALDVLSKKEGMDGEVVQNNLVG